MVPVVPWGPQLFTTYLLLTGSFFRQDLHLSPPMSVYILFKKLVSSPATKTFGRKVVRSSCPSCVSCACVFSCASEAKDIQGPYGCVWKSWYTPLYGHLNKQNDVFNMFNHQIWMFFLHSVSPRCAESPSPPLLGAATGGATAGRVHKPGPHLCW